MPDITTEVPGGKEPKKLPTPFDICADENYDYIPSSPFRAKSSRLFLTLAIKVLKPVLKLVYRFKIEGGDNLKDLKGGAITVSNHIHYLDCIMAAEAVWPRDIYFLSQKSNFGIPVVRHLLKNLHTIPIPENSAGYKKMLTQVGEKVHEGAIFHIYPEASMVLDCPKIRDFKKGAFYFAALMDVPVVSLTISKKKRGNNICEVLTVGKPVYAQKDLPLSEAADILKCEVHENMVKNFASM